MVTTETLLGPQASDCVGRLGGELRDSRRPLDVKPRWFRKRAVGDVQEALDSFATAARDDRWRSDGLARARQSGHNGSVKKTSLAQAKAHLSALVDEAEHHQRRTLILRHGKPAAAIVPVGLAVARRPSLSVREINELLAKLGSVAPEASAVEDLLAGRR